MSENLHPPDVVSFVAKIDDMKEVWMEEEVRPYLVSLLNRVQARIKRPICFLEGMGDWSLEIDRPRPGYRRPLEKAIDEHIRSGQSNILTRRFPELVQFTECVNMIFSLLGCEIGNIHPTVKPKGEDTHDRHGIQGD